MTPPARAASLRPGRGSLRALRSVAAALACVTAAAVGHHAAGGVLPAPAIAAVFTGSAFLAWLLAGRRVTPGQLLGLLALCQICVHLTTSPDEMTMTGGMIAGHLIATAVGVVVLARGERVVWHLAERLGLRLRPLLQRAAVVPCLRPPVPVEAPRSSTDVCLAYSRSLRGPPVSHA